MINLDLIGQILIDLIAGLILILFGYLVGVIRGRLSLQPYRSVLHGLINDDQVIVVLSTRPGPLPQNTPRVSFLEIRGFAEISKILGKFSVDSVPISSNTSIDRIRDSNVVILGSPVANQVSKQVWNDISHEFPYKYHVEGQYITFGDREYRPIADDSGKWIKDYCLLVLRENPYNAEKNMLISAGCHGFSTYAGIATLTKKQSIKRLRKAAKNEYFIALIEIDLKDEIITSTNIINCFVPIKTA